MALARRSAEPLIEALENILRTPAGSPSVEPVGGPHQAEEAPLPLVLRKVPQHLSGERGLFTEVRGETVWKVAVRIGSRVFWWREAPKRS